MKNKHQLLVANFFPLILELHEKNHSVVSFEVGLSEKFHLSWILVEK